MSAARLATPSCRWAPSVAALLTLLAAGACSSPPHDDDASGRPALGSFDDLEVLPPDERANFTELPGVAGFDRLSTSGREAVLARANRTVCPCGCPGHSIGHCLNQAEECAVAVRTATAFVEDVMVREPEPTGKTRRGERKRDASKSDGDDEARGEATGDAAEQGDQET